MILSSSQSVIGSYNYNAIMNNPQLYSKFNMLKNHKKSVLEKYVKMLNWREDGRDRVLEIGCAGGDFTNEVILPLLPKTLSRFVGVDINQNMLEYARKTYNNPNVYYSKLDIGGDISEFQSQEEPFDHAISFICLHLVPDQKLAMTNIFNLLNRNGDCLLYIIADNREADFFRVLHKKWGKYMVNCDNYVSPYYHRVNPTEMATNFMRSAGFSKCIADEIHQTIVFDDLEIFKGAVKAITPYYDAIRKDMEEEYVKDLLEVAVNNENKVVMPYKFMMVYGRK